VLAASSLIVSGASFAEQPRDLTELSLEELSNVEVTSVSRREEPLADAAAAIAVITNETLRRSGATNIPDALRLVPGLHVAQLDSSIWAVSSRGFTSATSAKLLVLTDTRSIYTPLFSGVLWDVQNLVLEDVDRIEVVRGPGASLWGANAVNGVINITTRSAKETQGAYFDAGSGTMERAFGSLRYGGKLGDGVYFRVFAQGFDRWKTFNSADSTDDKWKLGHFGFRSDAELSPKDKLTLQGDAYEGDVGELFPIANVNGRAGPTGRLVMNVAGGNVLARWTHLFESGSDLQLRAYYDGTHREDLSLVDNLDTFDVELQHRFPLPFKQEVIWGLNYRLMYDRTQGKGVFALNPPDSKDNLFSGFVQDQIAVLDSLKLTLGTKLEHNDFSGFEIQPTARIVWNPLRRHSLWASASRAVRVPTRVERDVDVFVSNPGDTPIIKLLGNKDYGSEVLLAYELGYRWHLEPIVFFDAAAYYNIYHRLNSLEFSSPVVQNGQTVVPIVNENLSDGKARGVEASVTLSPVRFWRFVANYTYVLVTIHPGGQDLNGGSYFSRLTPHNQFQLQSFLDLPARLQLDAFFRYSDSIPGFPGASVPAYATGDLRLSWQGWQQFEFSLVGRNLLQDRHLEFPGTVQIERSFYAKLAGRF
jgi:iron complex outermembrane receptor protein